jgi:hypothetical protein
LRNSQLSARISASPTITTDSSCAPRPNKPIRTLASARRARTLPSGSGTLDRNSTLNQAADRTYRLGSPPSSPSLVTAGCWLAAS